MRPRSLSSLLALITLLVTPVFDAVADVRLVRVWPEYREAASFVRIAEYFGGKESSRELIVRSQSAERAGYYFLARFDSAHAASGSILALEYILPGEEEARVQFFPVDLPAGSRAILAGVTGGDWPGRETAPTAWRLRLLGPTGDELVRQQSFLWSLPPASAETVPASTE